MRKSNFLYYLVFPCMFFVLSLAGCISVGTSPSPRFYMLGSIDKNKVNQEFNIPSNIIIGVGPINIPEYLNRPQIVTQDDDNMLNFAQFDRWGEPLDAALERVINENLTAMLPKVTIEMFPWNLFVFPRYQVIADIVQMESRLDNNLVLIVQWSILDLKNKNVAFTKRSEFTQPVTPHDYAGLAEAVSNAAAALSTEIAQAIADAAGKEKK